MAADCGLSIPGRKEMRMGVIIETKDLTKKFGEFTANQAISLEVEKGEIRAIIGENGAGKSTLMNMLYGVFPPTSGQILFSGEPVEFHSPKDAIAKGIGMVHQHFKLVSSLTVYENIMLGAEINKQYSIGKYRFGGMLVDNRLEREKIRELIERFHFQLNPDDKIRDISVGARQRVEILKMLYRDTEVLILDEPTAVLIPQEVEELIQRLRGLKAMGKTIILITHKLNEVKMCADNISVIRAGRLIGTIKNDEEATKEKLSQMMVGRPVILNIEKGPRKVEKEVLLSVEGLCAADNTGREVIHGVSFDIHKHEVLGVAGVEGNGQSELMWLLSGCMKQTAGTIKVGKRDITGKWPDEVRESGVGIIPEDRYRQGLCLDNTVSDNLIAGYHGKSKFCGHGFMKKKVIADYRKQLVQEFDIRLSEEDCKVSALSGGNAQKIIIAREFSQDPDVLLACQPTRGVDVGATEFAHESILKLRNEGKGILLISSDLSEVMGLSDRIIVFYRGEIVGEFDAENVTPEELGLCMSGAKRHVRQDKGGEADE